MTLYSTIKVHIVQKYKRQKEKDKIAVTREGYKGKLEYPTKIDVSEEELSKELDKSFETVNTLCLTEIKQAKLAKREVNQLHVWRTFRQKHYMEFSGVVQLIRILIATAGNTLKEDIPSIDDYFQNKEQNGSQTFRDMDGNGSKCMKMKLNGCDSFM